jgi:hypothetical protein
MLARTGIETRYSAYIASNLPSMTFSVAVTPGLQQYFGLVVEQQGLVPVAATASMGETGETVDTNVRAIEEWEKAMRRSIGLYPEGSRRGEGPGTLARQRAHVVAHGRAEEWKLLWDTYQTFAAAYMAQRYPAVAGKKRATAVPFHYSDIMSVLISHKPRVTQTVRKGTRAASAASVASETAGPYGPAWTSPLVNMVVHTQFARQFATQPWEPVGAVLQPVYFPNADRLPVPVATVPVASFESLEQSLKTMVQRYGSAGQHGKSNSKTMDEWTKYVHRCAMLDLVAAMCSASGRPFDRAGGSRRLVAIMTCVRHGYLPYSTEGFAAAWARLADEADDQPMEVLVQKVVGMAPPVFSAMV